MIHEIKAFLSTFSFFSRIKFLNISEDEFYYIFPKSIKYIPFFAVLSGIFVFFLFVALSHFIKEDIAVFFIFIIQYFIFNYFHFDGFLDTTDAFLSGRKNKEEILKIMDDKYVGSFAVLFGSAYIFLKIYLYINVIPQNPELIIFSFCSSRVFLVLIPCVFTNPAKNYGLGNIFIRNARNGFITSAIAFIFALKFYFRETLLSFVLCFLISAYFIRKIGGLTGDTLGFICEMAELIYFLINYVY